MMFDYDSLSQNRRRTLFQKQSFKQKWDRTVGEANGNSIKAQPREKNVLLLYYVFPTYIVIFDPRQASSQSLLGTHFFPKVSALSKSANLPVN